jgi:hypothetical protein
LTRTGLLMEGVVGIQLSYGRATKSDFEAFSATTKTALCGRTSDETADKLESELNLLEVRERVAAGF